ncbi:MAG: DUF1566 domain-containing protein [Nitrosomonadales bacterium]|nr:DUF1566 domain-containing protein [Nitrosomonadales bacterium]
MLEQHTQFHDNARPLPNKYPYIYLRPNQMKMMINKSTASRNSIASCRIMAMLLGALAIAGCGDAVSLKPFIFDMTRINQDGSVNDGKDYAKQPWVCVKDNQSGLVWEVKTTEPGLQNINNTYTWYDPDKTSNGGWEGKAKGGVCSGSDCDTDSYIKAVNAKKLCGLTDWYLPSRFELNTIVDTSIPLPGPTLPKAYFPESVAGKYWTDTTFRTRRGGAWVWRFDQGSDYVAEKSEALSIRLTHATIKKPAGKTDSK